MQDVKSIYGGPDLGNVGFAKSFNGDVIQRPIIDFGNAGISSSHSGICTITSESSLFPGGLKVNNILSFGGLDNSVPTFARITAVGTNDVTIEGVQAVTGVVSNEVPATRTQVSSLKLQSSPLERSIDNRLYSLLSLIHI